MGERASRGRDTGHFLLHVTTARFDLEAEPENPINPIRGHSILAWLGPELERRGYAVDGPDTEDWGWYLDVRGSGGPFLVGASATPDEEGDDFLVQVHRRRGLVDLLLGRNRLQRDDPFLRLLAELLGGPGFELHSVEPA